MLRTKTREQLYQMHTYRFGRVEANALRGFFHTIEKVQGHGVSIPDLQVTQIDAQTSTDTDVDASGTGRLYAVWAASGTAIDPDVATPANADVFIVVEDNNVVIARFKLKQNRACEVYYFDSDDGVGIEYSTDLEIRAETAAAGNPDAEDRPNLVVIWGDDAINTSDANLPNENYG